MKEIWKDIKGYKGSYQISNLGRVKSLPRTILHKNGHKVPYCGTILTPAKSAGYWAVALTLHNKKKTHKVHRLLAEAFIPNPENKPTVNHKNGIKTDNNILNIEWATYSENNHHAYDNGLKHGAFNGVMGADHPLSMPVLQFTLDGTFIAEYAGQTEAMRCTGISQSKISTVCNNIRKTAGGFIWKFK